MTPAHCLCNLAHALTVNIELFESILTQWLSQRSAMPKGRMMRMGYQHHSQRDIVFTESSLGPG